MKETFNIFEKFLENNKELLTTDLYKDYRDLKIKFKAKKKELIEFKNKNNELTQKKKMFKFSVQNNDGIIKKCARAQVEAKKINKSLKEQIDKKNKLIEKMSIEYESQIQSINEKFQEIMLKNDKEINKLKEELGNKNRKLLSIRTTSENAMNARSDLELFFIEQLQECKIEIAKKKKLEEERKKNMFPFLNLSISSQFNNNSGSTEEDSIFLTNARKLAINDIDPEYKEKLLRNLLNRINEKNKGKISNDENNSE